MSVDVFLLINLLALIHRNAALPARLPRPGRAPRTSCVIPEPRLPMLHSCLPTDRPDSIRLPSCVLLTAPLGLLYSAVVSKGVFFIRDTPQPPKPRVSILGSNWRRAQVRWLNVHGQLSSVLTRTAPLGLMYSAVVLKGAFSIRDILNLLNLVSPPLVPTGAVLKLAGVIPINRLMPLVRLRFCQWSSTPMFLLVSILTETYPLVTNPFSTTWSPPAVLSGVVLKLSGSISVVFGSC